MMKKILPKFAVFIVVGLLLSPIFMTFAGMMGDIPLAGRIIMICGGLLLCTVLKPVTLITGHDCKII